MLLYSGEWAGVAHLSWISFFILMAMSSRSYFSLISGISCEVNSQNECKIQGGVSWSGTLNAYCEEAAWRVSHVEQFAVSKQYISNLLKDPLPMLTSDVFELMPTVFDVSQYAQRTTHNALEWWIKQAKMTSYPSFGCPCWRICSQGLWPSSRSEKPSALSSLNAKCSFSLMNLKLLASIHTDIQFTAHIDGTFNLASGEAFLAIPSESKIIDDYAKLIWEGKYNAAALHEATSGKISHSWMVQFIGSRAIFWTVAYSDHDLHVASRLETITLPDSVTFFTNTQDTTRFIKPSSSSNSTLTKQPVLFKT